MSRFLAPVLALLLLVLALALALSTGSTAWIVVAVLAAAVVALAAHDLLQHRHSILRNYPVLGHLRFLLEKVRPELQQYFIERDYDGRPYDRETRTSIYEHAKGIKEEQAFGTERDVNAVGYEWLLHTTAPLAPRTSHRGSGSVAGTAPSPTTWRS